jgi:hypothetical protein
LTRFIDDLAGSISDIIKFLLTSLDYFLGGMLIVGIPLYLIVLIFGLFTN